MKLIDKINSDLTLLLSIIIISVFSGLITAFGIPILTIGLTALISFFYILFLPINFLLLILLLTTFVISGNLQYFLNFSQALWLPYFFLGALLIRLPMESFRADNKSTERLSNTGIIPIIFMLSFFFLASSIINGTNSISILVSSRNYLLPFALIGILILMNKKTFYWKVFWYSIPWLAIIQVPFVLYQHFVVAKGRASKSGGQISWDAVVGTFGGNQDGGGQSGTMALFLVFAIFAILGMKKSGEISKRLANTAFLSILVSVLFSEIKIVFILLPLATIYFYRRKIFTKPLKTIGSILIILGLVTAISVYYKNTYWTTEGRAQMNMMQSYEAFSKIEGNTAYIDRRTGEVSRIGAPIIWWNEHMRKNDILNALIGYGPSASRISSTIGAGVAAAKYPFMLTTNSISMLLWDLGILGTFGFVMLFLVSMFLCARILRTSIDTELRCKLEATEIGLVCILTSLMYNQSAVDNSAIQVLWASCIAFVATSYRSQLRSPRLCTSSEKLSSV
jgi:hypothetical protein